LVGCLPPRTALLLFLAPALLSAAPSGPLPKPPPGLPSNLAQVALTLAEISWDFGDVAPFDWRKELTSSDPTATFKLRWRYSGPPIDAACLTISNTLGTPLGDVDLPLGPVFGDGFRYNDIRIGDLPALPTIQLRVVVKDTAGASIGSPSNSVQISAESPPDPFLYTPLYINGVVQDTGVPGIAGSIWCAETRREQTWTAGVRRFDGGAGPIASSDRWHIGSNTKAFTCTLLALLIQNGTPLPGGGGVLVWDTRLSAVFPEWGATMHPRFINTTLRHLACHRSGLRMTGSEDAETRQTGAGTLNADPRAGRRSMAKRLLDRDHTEDDGNGNQVSTTPGTKWLYGSGNYLILGAVIEQFTGLTYENAMQTLLLGPLGITTAGFGMPTDVSAFQPHGHYREVLFGHAMKRNNRPLQPIWNAAGGLYLSQADWLRFCRLHLDGSEGGVTLFFGTLNDLHTPHPRQFPAQDPSGADMLYGFGWIHYDDPKGSANRVLTHDGTYFRFYARHSVHLDQGFAVVSATNIDRGYGYGDRAINFLHNHLIEKTKAKIEGAEATAGLLLAGSFGSTGIVRSPGDSQDRLLDHLAPNPDPDPDPFFTFGGDFLLAPLRQNDEYDRTLGEYFRAPQILSFTPGNAGLYNLCFSGQEGFLYEIYHSSDPEQITWRFLQRATGEGSEREATIRPTPGARTELYQVREVEP